VVVLVSAILFDGFNEFGDEGRLNFGQSGLIIRSKPNNKLVGDDAAALHVNSSVAVYFFNESAADLDRADITFKCTAEHTLDHTP
jgi:hypothetical protein